MHIGLCQSGVGGGNTQYKLIEKLLVVKSSKKISAITSTLGMDNINIYDLWNVPHSLSAFKVQTVFYVLLELL